MNVLEKIVADKKIELAQRKQDLPLDTFVSALSPSKKSLFDALNEPNAGFILECKKASPSKGLIREVFDLDEILEAYTPHAAGISVLTDEKYFQGTYDYLDYVTQRVSQPVLNKDFFIDEYQVHLARKYNADAILLMLSVLSDERYQDLAELAQQYQLDILTEVSNEEEAHRAIKLGAKIIGINNRNLRDLSTDLAATERLVPLLKENLSYDAVIISESGIYTHQDLLRLAPLVQGFLVGSSLMAEKDLNQAVNDLVLGTTKVCGITSAEDAQKVKALGAHYAGFIFTEKSKRCISRGKAQHIAADVPFNYVGVFVDQPVEEVADITRLVSLRAVQLHGNEDQTYIDELRASIPDCTAIWKAKGVEQSLPECSEEQIDMFLLDCKVGSESGGTGQQFSWQLLQSLTDKNRFGLAGGINLDNIQEAVKQGLKLIDINSGVESEPGVKDHEKLEAAFELLRQY